MLPKTLEKPMKNRLRFQQGFRSEFGVFRGGFGGERGRGVGAAAARGTPKIKTEKLLTEIF